VHDALGERRIEPVRDLNPDLQKLGHFDGLAFDAVLQRAAFEQLHGDKRPALEFADIVNRADIRMIESGAVRASRRNRSVA